MIKKLMKGNPPDNGQVITFPKLMSVKLDGIRCSVQDGQVLSYSLKLIPNEYIRKCLAKPEYEGLDGELIVGSANHELTYNITASAVMSIKGDPDFAFHVFDILGQEHLPYVDRLTYLKIKVGNRSAKLQHVEIVQQTQIDNQEQLETFYESNLAEGYEGGIVRSLTGIYKHGRCTAKSQDLLKYKPLEDAEASFTVGEGDYWITGIYEAQTNNNEKFTNEIGHSARSSHAENKVGNGMLGGFYVTTKTGVDFKVAPGKIKHDEREAIWQAHLRGEEIQHDFLKFSFLPVGMLNAPRHPRAIGWRSKDDL